jgi:hypothetical protein
VEWLKARRIAEDVFIPATAAECLEAVFGGMGKTTKSITIRKTEGKRYADIVSSVVGDTPEGGPNDMNFEDGDLDDLPF